MPGRRSHKKSKTGCQTCKKRRIKCDELHPQCGNCQNHGISCDFLSQPPPSPEPPSAIISIQRDGIKKSGSESPFSIEFPESVYVPFLQTPPHLSTYSAHPATSRLLELRLMHMYSTFTSKTLTVSGPGQLDIWGVVVPSLAFNAPYLMDAIFAVSALHLRSLQPGDVTLARASHAYMASAIAQYKSLLSTQPNEFNADALFVTSSLIAFYATASRLFVNDSFGHGDDCQSYEPPIEWFLGYQGVKAVVLSSWKWLRNSQSVLPIILSQPALSLDLSPDRHQFFDSLLEGIDEEVQFFEEPLGTETRRAYEHAVSYLNWAYQKPDRNRLMGFAATVSRRFVDLLVEQDPRTLVIVAIFFAMTKAVDDIWWLQGTARREVMGIFSLLPDQWWSKMHWAIKVSNADEPLDEEVWGHFVPLDALQQSNNSDGDVRSHIDYLVSMVPMR